MTETHRILVLAALSIVAFAGTIHNGFAFDDRGFIEGGWLEHHRENPLDAFRRGSMSGSLHWSNPGYYRPVATISKVVDFTIWGRDPRGFHLTNLVLHLGCVLLAHGLLRRRVGTGWVPFIGAAIFAVHPVHAESVAFMAGRTDVLYTLFLLMSVHLFLDSRERGRLAGVALAGSLFAFALALMSKETAACLPILLGMIWLADRRGSRFSPWWIAPHVAMLLAYVSLRIVILPSLGTVSEYAPPGGDRIATLCTMPGVFLGYLSTAFVPVPLAIDRDVQVIREILDARSILPLIVIAGWIGVGVVVRSSRVLLHGWGWFTIPLLPVSNIIPIGTIQSDRYLYLPVLGTAILTAWALDRVRTGRRHLAIALGASLCLLFLALTIQRNRDWRDDEALWSANLADFPDSIQARLNLGAALGEKGDHQGASVLFQEAIRRGTRDPVVFLNYGVSLEMTGEWEEAIRAYDMAITLGGLPSARERLGLLLLERGDRDKGKRLLEEALPHSEKAYVHLADLAREAGDTALEFRLLEDLVRHHPGNWHGLLRLAEIHRDDGRAEIASALYSRVLQRDDIDPQIRGFILQQLRALSDH